MFSRTTRITILLVIDVLFFLLEIITGYAVGSLALVADSFHMLNDVASLVIALYAIKLTSQTNTDTRYSYGWHRAEILAALINGVFLLALCFSIFMEAIERFFNTPEVGNPKLVVIVGSFGLASNILGLFLFHEHTHSHGHGQADASSKTSVASSRSTAIGESLPSVVHAEADARPLPIPSSITSHQNRERSESYSSLYGHPAATRASFVHTAAEMARERSPHPPNHHRTLSGQSRKSFSTDPLPSFPGSSRYQQNSDDGVVSSATLIEPNEETALLGELTRAGHSHDRSSHSHGSMNMRGILLHVLGDALGNVGVIATGLIIWFSSWTYKYYCDPIISLLITIIIFHSALPLVRSTSFILLQGVPSDISFEAVREGILTVKGVLSVHELHIWQLSESKVIASVHVTASRDVDFMPIASGIRKLLHQHGIHSSTIQPEYYGDGHNGIPDEHFRTTADTNCLINCPNDQACDESQACCPPTAVIGQP